MELFVLFCFANLRTQGVQLISGMTVGARTLNTSNALKLDFSLADLLAYSGSAFGEQ